MLKKCRNSLLLENGQPCGKIGKELDAAGKMIGFRKWRDARKGRWPASGPTDFSHSILPSSLLPSQRLFCATAAVVIFKANRGSIRESDEIRVWSTHLTCLHFVAKLLPANYKILCSENTTKDQPCNNNLACIEWIYSNQLKLN